MTTLIIGGGLSGLTFARALERQGREYLLLEARDRFGGRILTETVGAGYFDLGPAWFWPGQPRIAALIADLGLEAFAQHADGALTFEQETGAVERGTGFSSMEGSWRLKGGLGALTERVASLLPKGRTRLNAEVVSLEMTEAGVLARLSDGEEIHAARAVIAAPPRVAAEMSFTPALPQPALDAMRSVPTWMAGQAKAIAVYEKPFWREAGLSGDAMSRHGPMVEVHDASPDAGGPYALFGFIGVPATAREDEARLRHLIIEQLGRLFGSEAAAPTMLFIKDWARDRHTSTEADIKPLIRHPAYGLPGAMSGLMQDRLVFAGTETAPRFGGFLEGALESAENALAQLQAEPRRQTQMA